MELLRLVIAAPGKTVTRLAEEADIGLSRASQELRRLQSRGLLQTSRKGPFVRYLPEPDPQVPDARPLLQAMILAFAQGSTSKKETIISIASALSHPRRIAIFRELCEGPRSIPMLQATLHISFGALFRHLEVLQQGNLVRRKAPVFKIARNAHPLTKCLVELVRTQEPSKPN